MMETYAAWKRKLEGESLPALAVDLAAFDRNARRLVAKLDAAGSRATIRLATKSIRCPDLMRRAAAVSPRFQGWMTFRARETEALAKAGFDDFLLAYPETEKTELARLARLHSEGKRVAMVADSEETLRALADACEDAKSPFPVVVEIDLALRLLGGLLRFGARRSPLRTEKEALAFAEGIRLYPRLVFQGFMGYEAQIAGVQDASPFRRFLNPVKRAIRSLSRPRVARAREKLLREARARGLEPRVFNGGGSGSIEWTAREASLTELSAGSALLCPALFSAYSNQTGSSAFEPALFLALRCVRKPEPRVATCFGGGIVASGEPGWDKVPLPWLPSGVRLDPMEACGEVQTPILLPDSSSVAIGDPVLLRPAKAGEPLDAFERVIAYEADGTRREFPTYRAFLHY